MVRNNSLKVAALLLTSEGINETAKPPLHMLSYILSKINLVSGGDAAVIDHGPLRAKTYPSD